VLARHRRQQAVGLDVGEIGAMLHRQVDDGKPRAAQLRRQAGDARHDAAFAYLVNEARERAHARLDDAALALADDQCGAAVDGFGQGVCLPLDRQERSARARGLRLSGNMGRAPVRPDLEPMRRPSKIRLWFKIGVRP